MASVSWVVKASKLCNLRCSYCYEWNELGRRERMSLDLWRRVLLAARRYAEIVGARTGDPPVTHLIWHGGEPTLLPLDYVEAVLALQHEVLGEAALAEGRFRNALQTNLYRLDEALLDTLGRARFSLGVSVDLREGVRVTAGGQPSEPRVRHNMERLRARGVPFSTISVLARHTRDHLRALHDELAAQDLSIRILPLFAGPAERPSGFEVSDEETVAALSDLFEHWMESGCAVPVDPLSGFLETTILKMLGARRPPLERRSCEAVIVVNTDGRLYQTRDEYAQDLCMGDLTRQSIEEILASPEYRRSLERDDVLRASRCQNCEFAGACDGYPLFAVNHPGDFEGRCPIAYPVQRHIETWLRAAGHDEASLHRMLSVEMGVVESAAEGIDTRPRSD